VLACPELDAGRVASPAYVIDLEVLERNLQLLAHVQEASGCTILLALKGFAAWSTFPVVGTYLDGVAASGPDEARLGAEELGKQVHTYCPAFDESSLRETIRYSDHVVFNSPSQVDRFRAIIDEHTPAKSFGLRINPQHSEVDVALYDPCAPGSRLGTTRAALSQADLRGIDGLHCHHITKAGYDVRLLIDLVRDFKQRHGVDVFLEPGEAIGLNAGVLVASVLDIVENDGPVAILDTSATAHMPDVLEMPYRPQIRDAAEPGKLAHTYRLGGLSCLAGDMIGEYSFAEPLEVGDRLLFEDMAHYTMVKTSTFNGVRLPSIALYDPRDDSYRVQRRFDYADYRNRLS